MDAPARTTAARIEAVDTLRGVAMVLMALDHVRDFFGARVDPTDLATTTGALFFTRWVTHFCAPIFVLLAGTSAYLWGSRGRTRSEISRFLATRGLWLVFLEVTLVRLPWRFDFDLKVVFLQVIWALGMSMIALAALVHLPLRVLVAVGVVMIAGHDLADHVHADALGPWRPLWLVLHEPGAIHYASDRKAWLAYPLVPWIGVMAVGYAMGPLFRADPATRQRKLALLGAALVTLFFVVRGANVYGDPNPWSSQPRFFSTVLSFLNCSKYPPSLSYLLMTLGPSLLALAALDRARLPRPFAWIVTFGKVPLFYYVLHLWVLRLGAIALDAAMYGRARPALLHGNIFQLPDDYGYALPVVYVVWLLVVVALYPACVWFARLKTRHRGELWVSYV